MFTTSENQAILLPEASDAASSNFVKISTHFRDRKKPKMIKEIVTQFILRATLGKGRLNLAKNSLLKKGYKNTNAILIL